MEFHPITLLLFFANFLIPLASSSANHHHSGFLECLTQQFRLSNSPTDMIYTPQNSTYKSLTRPLNLRQQTNKKPDLIVAPYHESEIQAAIYCSRKLGLQIRIRSGGHDFEGLSSTSDQNPFVLIDMRNLRQITINAEEKTAWVQTGATIGEIYYRVAQASKTLAFVAGVSPSVGVGGQFSSGGYGMMARRHALAADHIIDARLINADGEILDRRTMGEDLFWAIRGGGGTSFGIVVAFKVTLVTVPEKVTVFNITRTSEENGTQLVHRWQYIADGVDENLLLRLFLVSIPSSKTGNRTIASIFSAMYIGPIRDLLALMQEQFPELGLVEQDCSEMSWIDSVMFSAGYQNQSLDILLDGALPPHYVPWYFKVKSDFVSTPIPVEGLEGIWRFLNGMDERMAELLFSPYGGALDTFSESATPFPHRKGNIYMIEYVVGWAKANESETHMDWIRKLHSYMTRYVTKSPRAAYINFRDLDIGRNNEGNTSYEQASVWGLCYFKNNFNRLVQVKTKVDPSNFFRNEQSIPPLSS